MGNETINMVAAYRDNLLIEACGPILSPSELARRLTYLPDIPGDMHDVPLYVRSHMVSSVWDLHIPSLEGMRVAQTVDVMLRQGYARCRPDTPDFWRRMFQNQSLITQPNAAAVVGLSGVGKSVAIEKALSLYPVYVDHERFPGFVTGFRQLLWLKIDAPDSGKSIDLAANLMRATDQALGTDYFSDYMDKRNRRGPDMFRAWQKIAAKHMLGLLIIDEIQNLFKQAPVAARRRLRAGSLERPELRIVEDETLKLILSGTNTWRNPLMVTGTPDGMEAFNTRLSTAQRLITAGYHVLSPIPSADDQIFTKTIFPTLSQYQWVNNKIEPSDRLRQLVFDLSAGVPRIYICLWIAAHRYAFEGNRDALTLKDFSEGFRKYLYPLIPAVEALKSNDPGKLARYEDALPKDRTFWAGL